MKQLYEESKLFSFHVLNPASVLYFNFYDFIPDPPYLKLPVTITIVLQLP